MANFFIYFKDGGYTSMSDLDMFRVLSELNQKGHRYDIAFIFEQGQEDKLIEIAETLKELGASDNEIEDVCATIYNRVINDHTRRILLSLKNVNPEKGQLFEGINDGKMDDWSKDKIEKFVEEHNLIQSDETKESIIDLDYFLEHKKLRREDKWQS